MHNSKFYFQSFFEFTVHFSWLRIRDIEINMVLLDLSDASTVVESGVTDIEYVINRFGNITRYFIRTTGYQSFRRAKQYEARHTNFK